MFQAGVKSLNFLLKILQLFFVLYGFVIWACSTGVTLVFRWYSGVLRWCSG